MSSIGTGAPERDIEQLEAGDRCAELLTWPLAQGANYMQFGVNSAYSFASIVSLRVTGDSASKVDRQEVSLDLARELIAVIFGHGPDALTVRAFGLNWHGRILEFVADRLVVGDFTLIHIATNRLAELTAPTCQAGWLSVKTDRHGADQPVRETIRPGLVCAQVSR